MIDSRTLASLLDEAFPARSLARRKIEMNWHELRDLDHVTSRRRSVMVGTGGEAALGQRILDMERQLIVLDGTSRISKEEGEKTQLQSRISRAEYVVRKAHQNCDIPTIVSVLSGSGVYSLQNLYNLPLQTLCVDTLRELCHKNAPNRSRLVNCNGIAAIVASLRIHAATCPIFLHNVTALLLSLPFYRDSNAFVDRMGMTQPHKESSCTLMKRRKIQDDDAMDMGIATLLIQSVADQEDPSSHHMFSLIADAVERDLFRISLHQPGDENGNYERLLAIKQIPVVCRSLGVLVNDPACLRRRLLFLRTCFASYLGDTSITTDTLGAIVL